MTIENPRINVAMTETHGQAGIIIRRSDADTTKPLQWVHWQFADIERAGWMAACERTGNTVLRFAAQAHPELFARHPLLLPPATIPDFEDPVNLVTSLIERSVRERSSAYVAALDAIFAFHATELAQTNLPEQWPTFRERFSQF